MASAVAETLGGAGADAPAVLAQERADHRDVAGAGSHARVAIVRRPVPMLPGGGRTPCRTCWRRRPSGLAGRRRTSRAGGGAAEPDVAAFHPTGQGGTTEKDCPVLGLAWAGGRSAPSRSCLLRRRTDRRHRTRVPKRPLRAASRAPPELLPFEDRLASNRSRHLPRWRARALRRPR